MNRANKLTQLLGLCLISVAMAVPTAQSAGLNTPREGWVSWQLPAVADAPNWCCFSDWRQGVDMDQRTCQLDGSNFGYGSRGRHETTEEIRVYARFVEGRVERLRTLAASCPVAATTAIRNLDGVTLDESTQWLAGVATQNPSVEATGSRRINGDAMASLAMHRGNAARDALAAIARKDANVNNRKDALFWLTQVRGNEGMEIAAPFMFEDADAKVREHAAFAVSQSKSPLAAANLIRQGNTDRDPHVRSQAWFWLAQTKAVEAENAIRAALQKDPDRRVREQAVFALSQLSEDRAARALIAIAEDKSLSRDARKKAIFWLGQMKSDSAARYLDKVLMSAKAGE